MNMLALGLTLVLVIGVPAVMVYAFLHHRNRKAACRRVALRSGFDYRPATDELCAEGLGVLERFTACREDVATKGDPRYVFARDVDGGRGYVFDYYTRGTPGSEGPTFHGTWTAFRHGTLDLPVFALAPSPALRPTIPVPDLPDPYAVWGRRTREGGWIDRPAIEALASRLGGWLRREDRAGRRWQVEGGEHWIAVIPRSGGTVELNRDVPPEEMPARFEGGREVADTVAEAWRTAR